MKAKKSAEQSMPPTTDEIEVLRRMLHTPPTPHDPKTATKTPGSKAKKS